jgi:hypothetical protein
MMHDMRDAPSAQGGAAGLRGAQRKDVEALHGHQGVGSGQVQGASEHVTSC